MHTPGARGRVAYDSDAELTQRNARYRPPDQPLDLLVLLADVDGAAWMDQALCSQTDPEAFFPEKGCLSRDAKRVCMSCPVRVACLDWAIAHQERFGIWGGLSPRQRRNLKRQPLLAPTVDQAAS